MKSQSAFKRFAKRNWFSAVLILPMLVFIFSFTLIPIFQTITLSFKDQNTSAFTLENYKYMFSQRSFGGAVVNSLSITAISLVIQISLGYVIALVLKQTFIGKGIARAIVLIPTGVPTLVSGVAMLYVFSTSGYLNEIFYRLSIMSTPIDWMSNKITSLFMVALADSWKVIPMVVLLILSGLESIPKELYEASAIDGVNRRQNFRYITLPQLKATMTMTILMRMVDLLKIFEMPQVLLGRSTPFLGTLAYSEYSYGNYNYSAVVSTVLLLVIIICVALYFLIFGKE